MGLCYKLKTQMLEAYFFNHKVLVNRVMRKWLIESLKNAKQLLGNDKTLQFIETKISCEVNKENYFKILELIILINHDKMVLKVFNSTSVLDVLINIFNNIVHF